MDFLVYGSKSFAQLIRTYATEAGGNFKGFIDDNASGEEDVVGDYEKFFRELKHIPLYLGVGYSNLEVRAKILQKLKTAGANLPNLIHPTSYVHPSVELGVGNVLMEQSFIGPHCKISDGCVFWPQSAVNHDSRIDSNVFFSPRSTTCGFTEVGHSTFVGAGAMIINNKKVEPLSFIKAMSTVK